MKFRGREVKPSKFYPRFQTKEKDIDYLAKSLRLTEGPVQDIVLIDMETHWEFIVGGRRILALEDIGVDELKEEWVTVIDLPDHKIAELIVAEDCGKSDTSDIEKGKMCVNLMGAYPERYPTQDSIAEAIGYSRKRVTSWISAFRSFETLASEQREELGEYITTQPTVDKERGRIPTSSFKEIAESFRDQPEVIVELTRESARRKLPRSKIREAKRKVKLEGKSVKQAVKEVVPMVKKTLEVVMEEKLSNLSLEVLGELYEKVCKLNQILSKVKEYLPVESEVRKFERIQQELAWYKREKGGG